MFDIFYLTDACQLNWKIFNSYSHIHHTHVHAHTLVSWLLSVVCHYVNALPEFSNISMLPYVSSISVYSWVYTMCVCVPLLTCQNSQTHETLLSGASHYFSTVYFSLTPWLAFTRFTYCDSCCCWATSGPTQSQDFFSLSLFPNIQLLNDLKHTCSSQLKSEDSFVPQVSLHTRLKKQKKNPKHLVLTVTAGADGYFTTAKSTTVSKCNFVTSSLNMVWGFM